LMESKRMLSGFPKRPRLPETQKIWLQNAASAARVKVGRSGKELRNLQKVEVQGPRRYSYRKRAIMETSTAGER
jgi:hypothetical protein